MFILLSCDLYHVADNYVHLILREILCPQYFHNKSEVVVVIGEQTSILSGGFKSKPIIFTT